MANSNHRDIHSALNRNPSTATGDYYPHRFGSRHSIASTVGPPPLSPRSPSGNPVSPFAGPTYQHLRHSLGSPWPILSAPSSPAPAPPPAVERSRGVSSLSQVPGPTPLLNPPGGQQQGGGGRVSPSSPHHTPVGQRSLVGSRPQSSQRSRATLEQEFTQKHAHLVDQAKLLLAEMQTLQILGPIHSGANNNNNNNGIGGAQSDDGTTMMTNASSSYFQSDDVSSLLSGSNTNTTTTATTSETNNTAVYYDQDETSMSLLNAILQGKLGSVVSKPPPRPARSVAREIVSRVGGTSSSSSWDSSRTPDEADTAEAIDLLMEDYEAVMLWARSSSSSSSSSIRVSSSGASSSSSSQHRNQTQGRIQKCLSERQSLLEAAMPPHLMHLCAVAMMHFGHEKMYTRPPPRASTPPVNGESSGHGGNANTNLSVSGVGARERERERGGLFQQLYANTKTFRDGTPVEEIPRHRFMKTDDGFAWDMPELASELESEVTNYLNSGSAGRGGMRTMEIPLRNPVTRVVFTPGDVSRILRHPMGRSLVPDRSRRRSPSPPASVRPASPLPLPEPVSSFAANSEERQHPSRDSGGSSLGEYRGFRPRLYGHDEDAEDSARSNQDNNSQLGLSWSPPSPPVPQSPPVPPPPPPPPPPAVATASAAATGMVNSDRDRDSNRNINSYPEPLRPYSPPSSPPPLLGMVNDTSATAGATTTTTTTTATAKTSQSAQQQPRTAVPLPTPLPRPLRLPGSYPTSTWDEREGESDERFDTDVVGGNRFELPSAAPPPAPTSDSAPPATVTTGQSSASATISRASGILEEGIANNLSDIRITGDTTATSSVSLGINGSSIGDSNNHQTITERRSWEDRLRDGDDGYFGPPAPSSPILAPPPLAIHEHHQQQPQQQQQQNQPESLVPAPSSRSWFPDYTNNNSNNTNYTTITSSGPGTNRGWASNSYLASQYGVATPPPSGPIPVSSLSGGATGTTSSSTPSHDNTANVSSSNNSDGGFRFSGYFSHMTPIVAPPPSSPPPSVPVSAPPVPSSSSPMLYQHQNQNIETNTRGRLQQENVNPFASSRDDSPSVQEIHMNVDDGPFELENNPPRLPELSGGSDTATTTGGFLGGTGTEGVGGRWRGRYHDDGDNGHDPRRRSRSKEWMGELSWRQGLDHASK